MPEKAKKLIVLLEGRVLGSIRRTTAGALELVYDEACVGSDATPLSTALPLTSRTYPQRSVLPFIAGLLPDNERVLARWASTYGVRATDYFGLLAHVGEDCAGAVQLVRPERLDAMRQEGVAWLTEAEIADRLRTLRADPSTSLWNDLEPTSGFSLAGAQAKTALYRSPDGRWGRPLGRTPTSHIVKVAVDNVDQDLAEHLTMRSAALLGLPVARSEILTFGDERAIAIARYDRVERAGKLVRVHQEDLCQALSLMPSGKYQADGGPGPVDVVALLRGRTTDADKASIGRFTDALILNWLTGGTDAHAKNYSLLLSEDQVVMAPLYDLTSAFAYEERFADRRRGLRMAMTVGGESAIAAIGRDDWERFAGLGRLDVEDVLERIRRIGAGLPDAISQAAGELRVKWHSPVIDATVDRVARHTTESLRRVG